MKILELPIPLAPRPWAALAAVTLGSVALAPLLPGWGNGMLCLLLGMAWGNLWPGPWQKKENAAVLRWNEKNMLAWATILLGFELKIGFLAGIPLVYLPALLLSVLGAVAMGEWMARRKVGQGGAAQARLLGAGNAICGNSAIAAVQPLIGASPAQIAVSVTLINALGLLGTLFIGPGAALMGFGPTEQAVLMGSLLQSVGHVSAAASGLGDGPALLAMSLKMGRILLLIPLLLWLQSFASGSQNVPDPAGSSTGWLSSLIREIPFYVWGFVLCALATNLLPLPTVVLNGIKSLTQWMLWIALAAIGMNIRVQTVLRQGRDALGAALGMFVFQILLVLGWLGLLKFL
jgi:uncharacterized integral membrane protein (TIGR00698 family)